MKLLFVKYCMNYCLGRLGCCKVNNLPQSIAMSPAASAIPIMHSLASLTFAVSCICVAAKRCDKQSESERRWLTV